MTIRLCLLYSMQNLPTCSLNKWSATARFTLIKYAKLAIWDRTISICYCMWKQIDMNMKERRKLAYRLVWENLQTTYGGYPLSYGIIPIGIIMNKRKSLSALLLFHSPWMTLKLTKTAIFCHQFTGLSHLSIQFSPFFWYFMKKVSKFANNIKTIRILLPPPLQIFLQLYATKYDNINEQSMSDQQYSPPPQKKMQQFLILLADCIFA